VALPSFRRQKCIGRGSSGVAWLVDPPLDDTATGADPAVQLVLKEILFQDGGGQGEMRPQFTREKVVQEAKLLASLDHPYILKILDYYVLPEKLVMVSPYAERGDLCKLVEGLVQDKSRDKNQDDALPYLEEPQLLRWFCELLSALQYLHKRKVLHRDIKTKNVFLMKDMSLRLGDFGVARELDATDAKAQTVTGTPYYYSPELCTNKPYGPKSDVWQLGVCMYEILAFRRPFDGKHFMSVVRCIMTKEPPPLPDRYSKHLRAIIMQMLQKDPEDRPSVQEILDSPFISGFFQAFRFSSPSQPSPLATPPHDLSSSTSAFNYSTTKISLHASEVSIVPILDQSGPERDSSSSPALLPADALTKAACLLSPLEDGAMVQVTEPQLVDSGLFSLSKQSSSPSGSPSSVSLHASMYHSVSSSIGQMVDESDRLGFTHFEVSSGQVESDEDSAGPSSDAQVAKMMKYLYVKQRGETMSGYKPEPIILDKNTNLLALRDAKSQGSHNQLDETRQGETIDRTLNAGRPPIVRSDPRRTESEGEVRESPSPIVVNAPLVAIVGSLSGSDCDESDSEADVGSAYIRPFARSRVGPDISDIPIQEIKGSLSSSDNEEIEEKERVTLLSVPVAEAAGVYGWSDDEDEVSLLGGQEHEFTDSIESLFVLDKHSQHAPVVRLADASIPRAKGKLDGTPSKCSSHADLYKAFYGGDEVVDDAADSDDDAVAYLVAMQTAINSSSEAATKARSTFLHTHALVPIEGGLPWMCDGPHCTARSIEGAQGFHCGVGCNYDLCISCVDENQTSSEGKLSPNPFDSEKNAFGDTTLKCDRLTKSWQVKLQATPTKRAPSKVDAFNRYHDYEEDISLEEDGMQTVLKAPFALNVLPSFKATAALAELPVTTEVTQLQMTPPKQLRHARGVHSAPAKRPVSYHTRSASASQVHQSSSSHTPSSLSSTLAQNPKRHLQLLYNKHGISPTKLSRARSASIRDLQVDSQNKHGIGIVSAVPSQINGIPFQLPLAQLSVRRAQTFNVLPTAH
jgi:serine/threonine protein kinase